MHKDEEDEKTNEHSFKHKMSKGGVCPVMIVVYIAMIAHIFLCKSLQKSLEALELYKRAKQLMENDEANNEENFGNQSISFPSTISSVVPEIVEEPVHHIQDKSCDFDYSLEEPKVEAPVAPQPIQISYGGTSISVITSSSGQVSSNNSMC